MSELFTGASVEAAANAAPVETSASTSEPAAAGVLPAVDTATTAQATASGETTTKTDPATATAEKVEKPPGPIPFETHKTALENARTKAVQEAKQAYAWADAIPEPHRQTVSQFYQLLDASPVDAIDLLFQQAATSPEHSAKLRSWIGRTLGGSRTTARTDAAPSEAALPEPDFEDQTTGAKFYSAERLAQRDAALERRIVSALEKKVGPLEQDFRTRQQRDADERALAKAKADADAYAAKRWAQVQQWPHFEAHKDAIAKAMLADESLDVGDAYISIVVPKLSQQERSDVVAGLQHKATAGGIDPATPSTAAQAPPKSFKEAFERLPASAWG